MKQFENRMNLIINYFFYNFEAQLLKIKRIRSQLDKFYKKENYTSSSSSKVEPSEITVQKFEQNFSNIKSHNFKKEDEEDILFSEETLSPLYKNIKPKNSFNIEKLTEDQNSAIEYFHNYEKLIKTKKFHKILLLYTIEAVYFILNIHSIKIELLCDLIGVKYIQVWRINYSYIEFGFQVLSPLKKHFLQVENYLITHLVWKGPESIYKWFKKYELMASNRSLYNSPEIENMTLHIENNSRGKFICIFLLLIF